MSLIRNCFSLDLCSKSIQYYGKKFTKFETESHLLDVIVSWKDWENVFRKRDGNFSKFEKLDKYLLILELDGILLLRCNEW